MESLYKWEFMNEPIYRWFIFLVVIGLIMGLWAQTLDYMRG